MMKKYRAEVLKKNAYPSKGVPCGVTSDKKRDIIEKIGPVMKTSRMKFWHELPECETSKDLTIHYDKVDSATK